eukprot:4304576-Pyramimonas_sp.AAC.1
MDKLNSIDVGCVPQNRERVYIVAIKRMGQATTKFDWPSAVAPLGLDIIYDHPRPPVVDYGAYPMEMFSPM